MAKLRSALVVLTVALVACSGGGAPRPSQTIPPSATPVVGPSASSGAAAFPLSLVDDNGVRVTLDSAPRRIVTFAPSLTEILFALGAGDRVVGVSGPFDNYPPAAQSLPHVAAASGVEPNLEKVESLRPDLFLYAFSGRPSWMKRLDELGIPVFTVLAGSFPDALKDIRSIGELLGPEGERRAAALAASMSAGEVEVRTRAGSEPRVSCFFDLGSSGSQIYTVGPGSFIYDLLRRAGCAPVTSTSNSAYPVWSAEALLKEQPDVYLVSSEAGMSVSQVGKQPGFSSLRAVRKGRVYLVDSDLVSRPGPRLVQALRTLGRDLHPRAFGAAA